MASKVSANKDTALADISKLIAVFDGKYEPFNEDEFDYEDVAEKFRSLIATEWPKGKKWLKGYFRACGSAGRFFGEIQVEDTPRGLYRLLYLVRPKKVDFSDMYKSEMFRLFSADLRFLVIVELWKYELGLYFYCPAEFIEDKQAGRSLRMTCGIPGADNGVRCTDETGRKFFEMVTKAAKYKWMVYGGNDFEV